MQEPDLGYGQLFGVLWRQRWYMVVGLLLGSTIGGVVGLKEKPVFTSTMQFLVEPSFRGRTGSAASEFSASETQIEVDTATQLKLMQSSDLIRRTMGKLKGEFPELNPDQPGSILLFKQALTVGQVAAKDKDKVATKIFQINYDDADAYKSQRVLQAMAEVYQDFNREQQKERLIRGLSFVNSQIPPAAQKVTKSESRLEQFQSQQGLLDPDLQSKNITASLNQLVQEQQVVRTQLGDLQSRNADLQARIGMSPQQAMLAARLTQSPRYQSLLNELQKTDLLLSQQLLRFQPGTPEIDQFTQLRQQQLGLLQTEVGRVIGSRVTGENLLSAGQLSPGELTLIQQMVAVQVDLQGVLARYQNLNMEEGRVRDELQRFPKLLATYNRLKPDIDLNRDTLKLLMKAQQEIALEIARGGFDWKVVEAPQLMSQTPSSLVRMMLLGAVAGVFVGGSVGFAREATDDSIHDSSELEQQVSLPLLGMIPEVGSIATPFPVPYFNKKARSEVVPTEQVLRYQPFREAMDLLYHNLQCLAVQGGLKSIVVTSAMAGEGKSTIALGLAISAARLHRRVLLIDGDLRRSRLHQLLNLSNTQGLSNLLMDQMPLAALLGQDGASRSNIAVLPAGPTPKDPAKLLSSPRMREMMQQLEAAYDLVIVDAPPVMGMIDALLEASCCSGTILVGRLGYMTRAELNQVMSTLKKVNLIGVVANGDRSPLAAGTVY